jgi:tyrosine-protein kinase Etk/Wzc
MTNSSNPTGNLDNFDPNFEDDSIIIKRYLSLFISNWYWFAFSMFIALTIVYGINRYGEKIFTVYSTLLIKDQQNGGGMNNIENFLPTAALFNSQQNLKNEMGILRSYNLNLRVIKSLPDFRVDYFEVGRRNIVQSRIYTQCPFIVITDSGSYQSTEKIDIKITSDTSYNLRIDQGHDIDTELNFGVRYKSRRFNFIIKPRFKDVPVFSPDHSNRYFFSFPSPESLANEYRGKLSVTPIEKDATLVTLSVSGAVAQQEADYLNKLMEIYIKQGLEAKNSTADSTIKFINSQLKTISDSLKRAEDALQDFRLKNKMVDITKEGSIIQSRLEGLENEKSKAELQRKYCLYLQTYINSRNESGDIIAPTVMGINDSELSRMVQALATLQIEKNKVDLNFSKGLAPVNLIEENIENARDALVENVKNTLISLDLTISDYDEKISQVYEDIKKLPQVERQLLGIQRKFEINNTVYTYLLEKSAQTGIAKASNVSDNKIIDTTDGNAAYQIYPRTRSNNIKAIILGLFIPGLLISLLYYFNNKIIDNSDIFRKTKVPVVGYISHSESRKELPVVDKPGSSLAESFRAVRTSLRYLIKDVGHPVISVTSTISSEGKTFVSVNLAAIIALLGKKVLLVGLDLRKPRIHKILDIDNSDGLSTYLSSGCDYENVIKETSVTNLFYATSGPVPPNPAELINGIRMGEFIERARNEFDFIIVDTPPIAVVADTLLLSDYADINLFIVRQRFSSKNTLELIQELYQTDKLKNMGIIVNDISLTGYYGYGLRYGYYKGYGYTYGKNYYGQYSYSRYGYRDDDKGYYGS